MGSWILLIISLGIILAGAELFVNGVEWLGKKLNLSEGAVGSVLAAVGTALPESIIPLVAFLVYQGDQGHEIGIGAILGAPLMLVTLAMFAAGIGVLVFRRRRQAATRVVADYINMRRDLGVFLAVYTTAILAGMIPPAYRTWQIILAFLMIGSYMLYVYTVFREKRNLMEHFETSLCYFAREQKSPALWIILAQVATALVLIIQGAHLFVSGVSEIAYTLGIPAFVLALVIAPVATELPEKFNSILWISREKDTLALGNITGAMVFQSSLIPAMGIFLTDWQLTSGALIAGFIALLSALVLFLELSIKKHIRVSYLLLCGFFYATFLVLVIKGIIS